MEQRSLTLFVLHKESINQTTTPTNTTISITNISTINEWQHLRYVSMCLCVYVSMCLCVYVSMCLCVYVSMCLCVYVSMSMSFRTTSLLTSDPGTALLNRLTPDKPSYQFIPAVILIGMWANLRRTPNA